MGLHSDITFALADAFNTGLLDAVTDFEGVRLEVVGFDPITETETTNIVNYSGRGVFGRYAQAEIDQEQILRTDIKMVCLQDETTSIPKIKDHINGYEVINVGKDPANVSWIVQLRLTGKIQEIIPPTTSSIFIADQSSTIVTDTTIGSMNNNTSPMIMGVSYESATATVKSGTFDILNIPQNYEFFIVLFHDETINSLNLVDAISGIMLTGWGAGIQIGSFNNDGFITGTNPDHSHVINGSLIDPLQTTLSIIDDVLSCDAGTIPIDTTLFPLCTIMITDSLAVPTGSVLTRTFNNNLVAL